MSVSIFCCYCSYSVTKSMFSIVYLILLLVIFPYLMMMVGWNVSSQCFMLKLTCITLAVTLKPCTDSDGKEVRESR